MIEIDREDLILLDSLWDFWAPASFFGRADIAEAFNRRGLISDWKENSARISRLLEKGLVVVKSKGLGLHIPTEIDLATAIREQPKEPSILLNGPHLGLTTLGGAVWESHVRPNWQFFVDCTEIVKSRQVRLEALDHGVVEDVLNGASLKGSVVSRTLRPWQVTYWKYLPAGVRLTFEDSNWNESIQIGLHKKRASWLASGAFNFLT